MLLISMILCVEILFSAILIMAEVAAPLMGKLGGRF